MSKKIQYTRQRHKISSRKPRKTQESWTDSQRKTLSRFENLEKYLPGRCAFTITICNSNKVAHLYTQEGHWGLQVYKIIRKNQSLYVHRENQVICTKWKRIGDSDKNKKNIQSRYRNGI